MPIVNENSIMTLTGRQKKKRLFRIAGSLTLGASFGLLLSTIAGNYSSQCMILCNSPIAMAYFALVGLLLSLRKG